MGYYPDPYAESENLVFLCDVRFWPYHPEEPDPTGINTRAILEVEDCINAEALGRGRGRSARRWLVRTRWPEKPYTVYDYVDGEIAGGSWPDTLPEEILEQMLTCPVGRASERCCLWRSTAPPSESVRPVRVSFHPEAGSQHLAFHSRERVLRCIDQYTARQYRHQSGQKEALAFARTSSCTSKTVSRVLYQTVIYLDVPSPVRSSHPGSGRASLGGRTPCSHTGVAPDRVYSDRTVSSRSGELLPRLSTLTDRATLCR